jgi:hypothetical protein
MSGSLNFLAGPALFFIVSLPFSHVLSVRPKVSIFKVGARIPQICKSSYLPPFPLPNCALQTRISKLVAKGSHQLSFSSPSLEILPMLCPSALLAWNVIISFGTPAGLRVRSCPPLSIWMLTSEQVAR